MWHLKGAEECLHMFTTIFFSFSSALPQSGVSGVSVDLTSSLSRSSYGSRLIANKAQALSALKSLGASSQEIAIIFGVAMTETNHFSAVEALAQQATNIKSGLATNYGFLNLNKDAITSVNPSTDLSSLNVDSPSAMHSSLQIAHQLIAAHGINGFLDFSRGGSQGLDTSGKQPDCPFDCQGYRNNVAARANLILADPTLLTNDIRIESFVEPK